MSCHRLQWAAVILAVAAGPFCVGPAVSMAAGDSPAPVAAPVNPAFVDYVQRLADGTVQTETEEGRSLGLAPSPVRLTHSAGRRVFAAPRLPAQYDLRTIGKAGPVKDQAACGACWAFATYGSLESWFLPAESTNFSENNLKNLHGFDWSCCAGGNAYMSMAYLSRWTGPVNEAADFYAYSCSSPTGLPVPKHVQNVLLIPDRAGPTDNDNIKQAVYTLGGLYTTYHDTAAGFNSSTNSYYYNGPSPANHAVTIVGWDDNHDRARFNTQPPGDGAFIVKNSWGSGWGEGGFYYVSYYDSQFGKENAFFEGEPAAGYTRCYQHDPYGWVGSTGYATATAWFANVFTGADDEALVAASWYSASPGSTYTLYVYLDPTSGPLNPSGPAATKTGALESAGYQTVLLDSPVSLAAGHKFSVVVRLTTPGYIWPIPYEFPYSGYSSAAASNPGESYIGPNGTLWTDITAYYPNGNVCLKAFATQSGALSVSPSSGLDSGGYEGGPFAPVSQTYTLSNPGSAAIFWSAVHEPSAVWVTLSPVTGSLAPGASTTVTVTINSAADSLPAGIHSDTVTFTNATNGVGNTTRPVTLRVAAVSAVSMVVTPSDSFVSSGPVGGPFSPDTLEYTVANVSDAPIDFSVEHNAGSNWLTCYQTLPAHTSTALKAWVNDLAGALGPGVYTDTITFTNITNGQGNTTRGVQLTILAGALSVTPADGLTSSGSAGGPFSPSGKGYTLTNTGAAPINWTAAHNPSANWITLSATSGTLAAGASTVVTVSINANANTLAGGVYTDTVTFTNTTNSIGNTARSVQLTVLQGALSVTPADGLTSTGPPGGPFSPSTKGYTLTNTGNAPIDWTAAHDPGVNWVSLSAISGTLAAGASTTVTISINSNANGLAGGVYSDTATFANATNGIGNTTRPVSLTVVTKALTSVVVWPSSLVCPSKDPRQLHAVAYFSDSTSAEITLGAWTSSRPSVCTVNSSGVITPVANGNANVTCSYTYSGVTKSGTCAVSVNLQTVWYIYLSPSSYTFYNRNPVQFTCQARTTKGWINVTDVCVWSSSDPSVATVSERGVVTPVGPGSASISAKYLYNGKYLLASGWVQVY